MYRTISPCWNGNSFHDHCRCFKQTANKLCIQWSKRNMYKNFRSENILPICHFMVIQMVYNAKRFGLLILRDRWYFKCIRHHTCHGFSIFTLCVCSAKHFLFADGMPYYALIENLMNLLNKIRYCVQVFAEECTPRLYSMCLNGKYTLL